MSNWMDNKGAGVWDFQEQKDKWGYLNNPRWSNSPKKEGDSISAAELSAGKGLPIGPEVHIPCGHWHKNPISSPSVTDTEEPLFITDGLLSFGSEADLCFKKTKDLIFLAWYGGYGTDIDSLFCVQGCDADAEYLWVADSKNYRIDVRKKSDLSYVNNYQADGTAVTGKGTGWTPFDVAVSDEYTYEISSQARLWIRDKTNPLSFTLYTITNTDGISDSWDAFRGIAIDATHIYLTVDNYSGRIYKVNRSTLVTEAEWGYSFRTINLPRGVTSNSNYLFVASERYDRIDIFEKEPSLAAVGYIGHEYSEGYTDGMFSNPHWVAANDNYLFVTEPFGGRIQKFSSSTFAFIDVLPSSASIDWDNMAPGSVGLPWGIAVDDTHIYMADASTYMVSKYTLDFVFVGWIGDPTWTGDPCTSYDVLDDPYYVAVDSTYLYIYESLSCSGNNKGPRIQKRLKSDLSYVASFDDVHYSDPTQLFNWVQAITTDGTNVYVLDNSNAAIIVIDCATMTLSANHHSMSDIYDGESIWVDGTNLYLTDSNLNYHGSINVWDTTDIASGIQNYTFDGPTWGDFISTDPRGITVDEEYIYVNSILSEYSGASGSTAVPSYTETVHRVLKINKSTGALVASQTEFTWSGSTVKFKSLRHIDCDADYLYLADSYYDAVVILNKEDLSFVKAAGGTGMDYQDLYKSANGICTYWPFTGGPHSTAISVAHSDEPQVWTMPGE